MEEGGARRAGLRGGGNGVNGGPVRCWERLWRARKVGSTFYRQGRGEGRAGHAQAGEGRTAAARLAGGRHHGAWTEGEGAWRVRVVPGRTGLDETRGAGGGLGRGTAMRSGQVVPAAYGAAGRQGTGRGR